MNPVNLPPTSSEFLTDRQSSTPVLNKFHKYDGLPPELRSHVLSYAENTTLSEYAQCSNFCNSEIKKFNTHRPICIKMKDSQSGCLIRAIYKKKLVENGSFTIRKRIGYNGQSWNKVASDLKEFLEETYRYANRSDITKFITIDMMCWPSEIMDLEPIKQIKFWDVKVSGMMFNDFFQFIKTNETMERLILYDKEYHDDEFIIPAKFFKCNTIRTIPRLDVYPDFRMDAIDFVESQNKIFKVMGWIDMEAIRARMIKCNMDNTIGKSEVVIDLSNDLIRTYQVEELFPSPQFNPTINPETNWFRIGRCLGYIKNQGKELRLVFAAFADNE